MYINVPIVAFINVYAVFFWMRKEVKSNKVKKRVPTTRKEFL